MFERVPAWSAGHPWWTFLILFVVTAGLGAGAVTWGHQADIDEVFLPDDLPEEATRRAVADAFGEKAFAFVLVRHGSEADRVSPASMEKLGALGARLEANPVVVDVTSLATVVEDEAGRPIRNVPNQEKRQILTSLQLESPDLLASVTSGRFNVLIVELDPRASDEDVVAALDGMLAAPGGWNPEQLSVTSAAHAAEAARAGGAADLQLLLPLALAVMVLVLVLLFGRLSDALMPVVTVLFAAGWAYAALPFLRVPYSPLLYSVAPLVVGIGIDYCLHMVNGFRESQRQGLDPVAAAREAGRVAGRPVALTALTTSIGFGSFLAAAVPQIRHWGILLVLGALASLVLALTLLPALLRLTPQPKAAEEQGSGTGAGAGEDADAPWLERLLERWAELATRRWPPVVTVIAFITIGAAVLATGVSVEPTLDSEPGTGPAYRAQRDYLANFGGQAVMEILLDGDAVSSLAALDAFEADVGAVTGVARVDGPASRARAAHDGILPDAANYTVFLESAKETTLVSGDRLLVRVQYDDEETDDIVAAAEDLADDAGLDARFTGRELIQKRSEDLILESILLSTAIAFALVLVVLGAVLRSFRATATAFLPLLVVLVWQFGFMAAVGVPLNPVTGVTTAMVIGVGIDFSLHLVHRSRNLLKGGMNPRAAAVATLRSVGQPVLAGAVTTVAAFILLSFSENSQVAQFGRVAAVVVASAMVVSLGLVPIVVTGRDTHGQPGTRPRPARAAEPAAVPTPTQKPTPEPAAEIPTMPVVPAPEQATPWMQLRVRCPRCKLPLVFRVRGHERAPGHLSCPRCRARHRLGPEQVYQPVRVPPTPDREAAFRCGHCHTEWRVGPVPPSRVDSVRPGPCPSCEREDKLSRFRPSWP